MFGSLLDSTDTVIRLPITAHSIRLSVYRAYDISLLLATLLKRKNLKKHANQFRFNVKVGVMVRNRVRKCFLTLNGGSQGRNVREGKIQLGRKCLSSALSVHLDLISHLRARGTARPTAPLTAAYCFCFRSRACVSRDWTELFACGPVTGSAVRRARRAIIFAGVFQRCVSSTSRTVLAGRCRAEMGLLFFFRIRIDCALFSIPFIYTHTFTNSCNVLFVSVERIRIL